MTWWDKSRTRTFPAKADYVGPTGSTPGIVFAAYSLIGDLLDQIKSGEEWDWPRTAIFYFAPEGTRPASLGYRLRLGEHAGKRTRPGREL